MNHGGKKERSDGKRADTDEQDIDGAGRCLRRQWLHSERCWSSSVRMAGERPDMS
jgi:hypothetical protein